MSDNSTLEIDIVNVKSDKQIFLLNAVSLKEFFGHKDAYVHVNNLFLTMESNTAEKQWDRVRFILFFLSSVNDVLNEIDCERISNETQTDAVMYQVPNYPVFMLRWKFITMESL